jgi:hypothetical protein
MSKLKPIIRNNFSGGISDTSLSQAVNEFSISKHFDIFTDPNRIIPYRSLETDTNDGSTSTGMKQYYVRDTVYASSSAKLYGLGQNASGKTKIVYKADAITGNWTLPSSSEGDGAVQNGCFFEFKDYLWGFQGTNQLFKWGTLSGTPSITNSVTTVSATITSVANGVIASDANAYLAYNNVIVRIAPGGTVTDNAKTVPTSFKITSLANMGSYLAIGCSPVSNYNGESRVYIWNMSSDLFQETIPWGEGELRVLDMVEGILVGVSDRYLNNTSGAGKGSMIIQTYTNGAAQVIKEIFTQAQTGKSIPQSKAIRNNRLFWSAKIMTNSAGTEYIEGLWSFGRKNSGYNFALNLDIIDENVSTSGIQGFGTAANYFFIFHSNDGSIDKTDDTATYNFTSILETNTFYLTGDDKLNGLRIMTDPLPSGATVTAKYKVNYDTSWTTIGSISTQNTIVTDFVNIASTGMPLPAFQDFKLRFESTGGAVIRGYQINPEALRGAND